MLGLEHLRKVVDWARRRGAIVASDECYLGLSWEGEALSILDERVNDGDLTGLLAVHSLSKTSNLASYRAGFVTGDRALVAELLEVRKHAGMMVPLPIQSAMTAALSDDDHENEQRERYRRRREILLAAVRGAEFTVDNSEAGLYLWATRGEACRDTVEWFAERGHSRGTGRVLRSRRRHPRAHRPSRPATNESRPRPNDWSDPSRPERRGHGESIGP